MKEYEIYSYLPSSNGGLDTIFRIKSKLTTKTILSKLKKTAKQIPEFFSPVQFIYASSEISKKSYQILRDGEKVTQRLTVYDVLFGAKDWNGKIFFPPYLTVIKLDPDEDEDPDEVFVILINHPRNQYDLTKKIIDEAGFKGVVVDYDELYEPQLFCGDERFIFLQKWNKVIALCKKQLKNWSGES